MRSAVVAPLRDAISDDGACLRGGCELGLVGLTLPELDSVVLDVDEVLDRLDVVVLFDVDATFAGSLPVLPLPPGTGINISCTSTTILDLDLATTPPFEADLEAESPAVAALLEDDDGASFTFRPDPDLATSFV